MPEPEKRVKRPRRRLVRAVSFLAAGAVALAGAAVYGFTLAGRYRVTLEYTYRRALEDLGGYLDQINAVLQKSVYAGTAQQFTSLSEQVWRDSGAAKTNLSQLPVNTDELGGINLFLSQAGDYCLALSEKAREGESFTEEERENLRKLSSHAQYISLAVGSLAAELAGSELSGGETERLLRAGFTGGETSPLAGAFENIEQSVTDFPTLIYDGPFSQHLNSRQPQLILGKTETARESARRTAAEYLGVDASAVSDGGDEEGNMPSYGFCTETAVASVTKQGGFCVYLRDSREIGPAALDYDTARKKAAEFLSARGLCPFAESYYMAGEGMLLVNFAYREGDVICYPDLVKVGVALDDGQIVLYEARGYIMNHTERELPEPQYSEPQARAVLSGALTVNRAGRAVIPTPGGYEVFCYEFSCTGTQEENVLVYVNAATLAEEQILILQQTDGGTLVR